MSEQLPILVLLPGMDGTGEQFHELLQYLDTDIETIVVAYPRDQQLNYLQLENVVRARLPQDRDFVLLGESFSGPIAISFASQTLPQMRGLIVCASFCRNPQPLLIPLYSCIDFISPRLIPRVILERVMFGSRGSPQQRQGFFESLYSVDPAVIQHRCKQVLRLNYANKLNAIVTPVLYLQGEQDHLVASRYGNELRQHIADCTIQTFPTAHMLLQTEPQSAAKVISQFVRECL
jgi:pimeloyl-[acyl-carrier protein] methyl ester esterase